MINANVINDAFTATLAHMRQAERFLNLLVKTTGKNEIGNQETQNPEGRRIKAGALKLDLKTTVIMAQKVMA